MGIDRTAAEALLADVLRSFTDGLEGLIATAASEAVAERKKINDEAMMLTSRMEKLEEEHSKLVCERERFEQERLLFGPSGLETSDMVSLNIGGESHVTVLRSTLTQCEESMLAAAFSGRWELPRDDSGEIFMDFEPEIFLPLVHHMRMRRIEDPEDPTPPPELGSASLEARFQRMLRYYGLEEWVYRHSHAEPLQHQVQAGDYLYAVLPPQSPEENIAFGDMSCQTVGVPRGWEVLQTDVDDFEEIIRELANHSWGALRLCCRNPGGGFSSYLTRLHGGGTAGARWSGDARLLQAVGGPDSRQFRFATACSARLVVRTSSPTLVSNGSSRPIPVVPAGMLNANCPGGGSRRLAAI